MKSTFNLILVIVGIVIIMSFSSRQSNQGSAQELGKYKVEILYPGGDDKTFDMDYYEKKHMPMVAAFLGKNLRFYEIDKGLSGRTPNDKAPFVAIGYFYIDDIAEYGKAIAQNRDAVVNDFKNYTNIQPVIQISEIKQVYTRGK